MTAQAQTITRPSHLTEVGSSDLAQGTLAGEHALLMREVARRAAPVLALLDARAWPHAELGTLTAFLRSAVLRQASDEEVLLYPHDTSVAPFAELSADHVRLHSLTLELQRAHAEGCDPRQLRASVDELLTTLHRHLLEEQAVLAALPDAPDDLPGAAALTALAASARAWPSADEGPVLIDLDALPAEHATHLCIERVLRLRPGQRAEIHSEDDGKLTRICRWLHAFDSTSYGVDHDGPARRQILQVTRRPGR